VKASAFDTADCRARHPLSIAFELRSLTRDLRRLPDPMRASPEAIFLAKDEIAGRIFQIAAALEHGGAR